MQGYDDSTYGEAFADVYDEWYSDVSDVGSTVAAIERLAGPAGRVLELGVGTGRLAIPLAARGLVVIGIDTSAAMLARLEANDPGSSVATVLGEMVDEMPAGPFDVILAAYNTFFNLPTAQRQQVCFGVAAERLAPGGRFVVEAFVPELGARSGDGAVSVRSLGADRVVLSISRDDPRAQRAEGQYVELTEGGGVRLRPWSIRYAGTDELDTMAGAAGLELAERWGSFAGEAFDEHSQRHVSVYRRR